MIAKSDDQINPTITVQFGDPRLPDRFWSKIQISDSGCWEWAGEKNSGGYAKTQCGGKRFMAHRLAYLTLIGPIPPDLQCDHLCRVRHCVNPSHVEPVTQRENILRGVGIPAVNAKKTHCIRGHEFTAENTRISTRTDGRKRRKCRACHRRWNHDYYAKKRQHG